MGRGAESGKKSQDPVVWAPGPGLMSKSSFSMGQLGEGEGSMEGQVQAHPFAREEQGGPIIHQLPGPARHSTPKWPRRVKQSRLLVCPHPTPPH